MGHEVETSPEGAKTGDVTALSLVDAPSSVNLSAFTCSTEMEGDILGGVVTRHVEGSGGGGVTGVVVTRGAEPVEGSGSEGEESPGGSEGEESPGGGEGKESPGGACTERSGLAAWDASK